MKSKGFTPMYKVGIIMFRPMEGHFTVSKSATDNQAIRDVVERVLKERFDDVEIESIEVESDYDDDGDRILRVQVVFDGTRKKLDAHKTSSVLRYMRPKLEEIDEFAFPVISYIAASDLRKSKAATS